MSTYDLDRLVDCPECHAACEWCAWYAKNARECGCGRQWQKHPKCEWGETLKGTSCSLCDGSGKARLVGRYEKA